VFLYYIYSVLERIGIHILKLLSFISKRTERKSISKEVTYIISTNFATNLRLKEILKVVVKWGDIDEAILDLKKTSSL
jgi:hypothetical protein